MPGNAILGSGGLHHACVKTRNWATTMRFYCEGLGCVERVTWRAAPRRAAMLDIGDGNYIEVFEEPASSATAPGPVNHIALRTTRIEAVVAHLRSMGVPLTLEPRNSLIQSTNGRGNIPIKIAFCEGPNGESIELLQNDTL